MSERKSVIPGGPARGVLLARALRYCAAVFAGYLFGAHVARLTPKGPGVVVAVVIGGLALLLIFRAGAKSQSHAAADAISTANARAEAAAAAVASVRNAQVVNVHGAQSNEVPHVAGAAGTHVLPGNVSAYPPGLPADTRYPFPLTGHEVTDESRIWD